LEGEFVKQGGYDVETAFAEEEDGAGTGVGAGWEVVFAGCEVVEVDLEELG
jgi:hypothetical protein